MTSAHRWQMVQCVAARTASVQLACESPASQRWAPASSGQPHLCLLGFTGRGGESALRTPASAPAYIPGDGNLCSISSNPRAWPRCKLEAKTKWSCGAQATTLPGLHSSTEILSFVSGCLKKTESHHSWRQRLRSNQSFVSH